MPELESSEWRVAMKRIIPCVVSIHYCQTHSFDTESPGSYQATGFVIDAERGFILTNRHVACAGPFSGRCIFNNHEEV